MPKILLAWLGRTDINCAQVDDPKDPGPTACVVEERTFDALVLLSNYARKETHAYVEWLSSRAAPRIIIREAKLEDPTDYASIRDNVVSAVGFVEQEFGKDADLAFHVNPGTHPFPLDIVVFTPDTFADSVERGANFATDVATRGVVLHEDRDSG